MLYKSCLSGHVSKAETKVDTAFPEKCGRCSSRIPTDCKRLQEVKGNIVADVRGVSMPLRSYFLSEAYGAGVGMQTAGTGYRADMSSRNVPVYLHEGSGIMVWTQAVMLAEPSDPDVDVIFHYAPADVFHQVASVAVVTSATWNGLKKDYPMFGFGVYATAAEPDRHRKSPWADRFPLLPEGAELASHCFAILISPFIARCVWALPQQLPGSDVNAPQVTECATRGASKGGDVKRNDGNIWLVSCTDEAEMLRRAAANAESRFQRIVALCEADLGGSHPETLDAMSYLAYLLDARGNHFDAEPLYRRVLNGYVAEFGPNHPHSLRVLNNLAALLQAQHRYEEAEPLAHAALRGSEITFGPLHADTITSAINLAHLQKACGLLEKAESLFRRSFEWMKATRGLDHMETLVISTNLADVLQEQGKTRESEKFYRTSVSGLVKIAGLENVETLAALTKLVNLLHEQDLLYEAEILARKALVASTFLSGENHDETLSIAHRLAHILLAQGNSDEAEEIYRNILTAMKVCIGCDHVKTLTCMSDLAELLDVQGRYHEAEALYRQCLQLHSQSGCNKAGVVTLLQNLGGLLERQGNLNSAEGVFRLLLELGEEHWGHSDAETLRIVHHLAYVMDAQDKREQAELLYRRALDGFEASLGPSHADTVKTLNCLACLLNDSGKILEGDPIFERILLRRIEEKNTVRASLHGSSRAQSQCGKISDIVQVAAPMDLSKGGTEEAGNQGDASASKCSNQASGDICNGQPPSPVERKQQDFGHRYDDAESNENPVDQVSNGELGHSDGLRPGRTPPGGVIPHPSKKNDDQEHFAALECTAQGEIISPKFAFHQDGAPGDRETHPAGTVNCPSSVPPNAERKVCWQAVLAFLCGSAG